LRSIGMQKVEVMSTEGHPVVYGEWLGAPGKPTVMVYGHYDVQPVDPLNEWISGPFEPTVRGDNIYARGASDMKGQVHAFLKALEALAQNGGLPLNVKVLVEGEEEVGSVHLSAFLDAHKEMLQAHVVLNADSGILAPDQPALMYGLRGLAYFEVWVYGPKQDLHSGLFGGSVHNPAQVMCELIARMHDEEGRVMLPGFYDQVRELPEEERVELARLPYTDEMWKKTAGVTHLHGEKGFSTIERLGARPTLEVNGILSGFTGEGAKTVLPAKAMAKISMRLVPYQNEKAIEHQLREYMRANVPEGIRWEVKHHVSAPGVLVRRDTKGAQAAARSLEEVFGVPPIWQLQGGSVPVVSMVKEILGQDSVMLGFGLPDDNFHSPNEKLHLPNYYRGIETYIRFFEHMAE
ncbi:MAG: dipeptidase, partial [Anaerolineae bacterium]